MAALPPILPKTLCVSAIDAPLRFNSSKMSARGRSFSTMTPSILRISVNFTPRRSSTFWASLVGLAKRVAMARIDVPASVPFSPMLPRSPMAAVDSVKSTPAMRR